MSNDYEKNRCFGKPENIEKRLAMWANSLSLNKDYPWVGLGLIDDLKCACKMLGGDPEKLYPNTMRKMTEPAKPVEYDL